MRLKIFLLYVMALSSLSLNAQQLKLFLPKDNSFIQIDSIRGHKSTLIKWSGAQHSQIKFDYSIDNEKSWIPANLWNYFPDDTTAYWWLPNIASEFCKVRLSLKSDSSIYTSNESAFTLYFVDYNYFSSNEIFMRIGNNGMGSHNPIGYGTGGFLWPGGDSATISAIFIDGLVWGGKVNGQIRVNGNTYRNGLLPGRILEKGKAENPSLAKNKIFKIRKNWQSLPESDFKRKLEYDYNHWPVEDGAPWDDINQDGVFTKGIDKPKFIGDETLFYVANDLDTATSRFTYGSDPIGLEFQTTVFGFNRDDLKDVVFKKFKMINKSPETITEMYLSYWADDDLGYPSDDYIGCDTLLNLGYTYNGDNNDETGYGICPPAVGHLIVQPPIITAEPTDSARYGDKWKKGVENLPLTSFNLVINSNAIYSDPDLGHYAGTLQFYNLMEGLIWDGSPIIDPNTGLPTHYCLAGDPVAGTGWYEGLGWPAGPRPGNRRYSFNSGNFNIAPNDTQEVVYAIMMAKGTDNINSITKLRELAAHVQEFYNNELVDILNTKQTVAPTGYTLFQNYPNPFNPKTTIEYEVPEKSFVTIKIYDILGREVQTLVNNQEQVRYKYKVVFDSSSLASGVYFYRLQAGSFTETKKMMVLK